jgi:hypothetical protein
VAEETPVLRAAETDRDHASKAWQHHVREMHPEIPHVWCATCFSLDGHVRRTERQVGLLPAEAESEEMF